MHVLHTTPQGATGSPLSEQFAPCVHNYHHSRHALSHYRRRIWGVDYSTFVIHESLLVRKSEHTAQRSLGSIFKFVETANRCVYRLILRGHPSFKATA